MDYCFLWVAAGLNPVSIQTQSLALRLNGNRALHDDIDFQLSDWPSAYNKHSIFIQILTQFFNYMYKQKQYRSLPAFQ